MKNFLLPALAVISFALLPSCAGYHMGSVKPAALVNVHTLSVPNAKNLTLEPRIDAHVTNAVLSRLQEDGTYKVAREGAADAQLELTISKLERRQMRSARFNTLRTRELGLMMTVDYRLVDLRTQAVLRQGSVRGDTTIFIDSNYQAGEREALPEAAQRAADRLVSHLSEGW
jgi:outer membrane lipopolysaccharide assembly protein LptE/RlpB